MAALESGTARRLTKVRPFPIGDNAKQSNYYNIESAINMSLTAKFLSRKVVTLRRQGSTIISTTILR